MAAESLAVGVWTMEAGRLGKAAEHLAAARELLGLPLAAPPLY